MATFRVTQDGVNFFEMEDTPENREGARQKGYQTYITASKGDNTQESYELPDTPENRQGAEAKGYQVYQSREDQLAETGQVGEEEIQAIADDTGADPTELKDIAPLYGVFPEGEDKNYVRRAAGFVDRSIGLNLGSFAYKKLQDEPTRKAFDQLAALADERRSRAESAAELVGGIAGGIGAAKLFKSGMAATQAAKAAPEAAEAVARGMKAYDLASLFGGGAAAGFATSEEGEELEGAAFGAAGAGVLGGLFHGAAKLLGRYGKNIGRRSEQSLKDVAAKTEQELEKEAPYIQQAEQALDEVLTTGKMPEQVTPILGRHDAQLADDEVRDQVFREMGIRKAAGQAGGELDAEAARHLATKEVQEDLAGFVEYVADRKVPKAASKLKPDDVVRQLQLRAEQEGPDFIKQEFRRYQAAKAAIKAMADEVAQELPREATTLRSIARFIQDGREVASQIDNRVGTRLEPLLDEGSKANNALTMELSEQMDSAKPVLEDITRTNLRELSVEALKELEAGNTSGLSTRQQEAFKGLVDLFENLRKRANALGLPIQHIKETKARFYIPRAMVDVPEAISRLQRQAEGLGIDTRKPVTDEMFEALEHDRPAEYRELKKALDWLTERPINSAADLGLALREATNPSEVESRIVKRATASLARAEDGVPDMLRETDLNKLASKWMYNTFRHAYFRDFMAELATQENMARAAGDFDGADFVHKLRQDLAGGRRGTVKRAYNNAKVNLQVKAKNLQRAAEGRGDVLVAKTAGLVAESPEIVNLLMAQVYPNFLGLNPRAILTNMSQTFFMTMPELGGAYGVRKVAKAQAIAAAQMAGDIGHSAGKLMGLASGDSAALKRLKESGHFSEQQYARMMDVLARNIKAGAIYRMSDSAINKFTNFAMKGFEYSERFNRLVALNTAADVAKDLFEPGGSKQTWNFVNRMGRGYGDEVKKAVSRGDTRKAQELVENYLIGKTIFNYNQATLSEYGRTLGPLFSVFSKWPSAIAGDILTQYQRKGAAGGTADLSRKYLVPLATALYLNGLFELDPENSPETKGLLGAKGLATAAPISSVNVFVEGHLFQPPAVQFAMKAVKSAVNLDPEAAYKLGNEMLAAYMPGAALLRIMGTDVPRLSGEEPEGTLLHKTMEAISPGFDLDSRVRDTIGRGE